MKKEEIVPSTESKSKIEKVAKLAAIVVSVAGIFKEIVEVIVDAKE